MAKKKGTALVNEFITVSDIREYLKVSASTAYELTHRKDFPVLRMGNSIRVPKEAFLAWVALNTIIPVGVAEFMRHSA